MTDALTTPAQTPLADAPSTTADATPPANALLDAGYTVPSSIKEKMDEMEELRNKIKENEQKLQEGQEAKRLLDEAKARIKELAPDAEITKRKREADKLELLERLHATDSMLKKQKTELDTPEMAEAREKLMEAIRNNTPISPDMALAATASYSNAFQQVVSRVDSQNRIENRMNKLKDMVRQTTGMDLQDMLNDNEEDGQDAERINASGVDHSLLVGASTPSPHYSTDHAAPAESPAPSFSRDLKQKQPAAPAPETAQPTAFPMTTSNDIARFDELNRGPNNTALASLYRDTTSDWKAYLNAHKLGPVLQQGSIPVGASFLPAEVACPNGVMQPGFRPAKQVCRQLNIKSVYARPPPEWMTPANFGSVQAQASFQQTNPYSPNQFLGQFDGKITSDVAQSNLTSRQALERQVGFVRVQPGLMTRSSRAPGSENFFSRNKEYSPYVAPRGTNLVCLALADNIVRSGREAEC